MAGMKVEEFNKLESIVDNLLASGLNKEQLSDVNSIIRIAYKHIHQSNDLVEKTTEKMELMNSNMDKVALMLSPVSATMQ